MQAPAIIPAVTRPASEMMAVSMAIPHYVLNLLFITAAIPYPDLSAIIS